MSANDFSARERLMAQFDGEAAGTEGGMALPRRVTSRGEPALWSPKHRHDGL